MSVYWSFSQDAAWLLSSGSTCPWMETLAVSDLALELVVLCPWFYGLLQLLSLLTSISTTTTITTSNTTPYNYCQYYYYHYYYR